MAKRTKVIIHYELGRRFERLPKEVFEAMKREFMTLPQSSDYRWHTIRNDLAASLKCREALVFLKHTGCSMEELVNPDYDLLDAYLRKDRVKQNDLARKYGLSPKPV